MGYPDKGVLCSMYETMATIKRCDERFLTLLQSGAITISYYSPRGEEAISAAVAAHLERTDYMVTTYRGLHDHIAKGVPLDRLWAEFLGKASGTCKGKGGPMHITDPSSGLMVTTGVVGSGLPIANGLALASKLRGERRVVVCNFGDGASNIGAFHEALNLASVWQLPVVFVCQNNQYAEHTRFSVGTSADTVASRSASYRMPGLRIDGNDPIAVYEAAGQAVERARDGGGPTLLEAMTFRFRGHMFGDDGHYIPEEEMIAAVANDPIPRYRAFLQAEGLVSDEELGQIDQRVAAAVAAAEETALAAAYPDASDVLTDVYALA